MAADDRGRHLCQLLLDSLTDPVAILDEDGALVAVSQAWRDHAASGASLARGGEGADYLAACAATPGGPPLAAAIEQALAGAAAVAEVEYHAAAAGELRWFACRVRRCAGDGPARVVVTHVDVTAAKRAQWESAEQAERLRLLSSALPLVLWQATIDAGAFAIRWVSANAERVLGVSADELADAAGWTARVHPEDLPGLRSVDASAAGSAQWLEQYRWVRPDGVVLHLQSGITTRPNPDGSTLILGFALDISDAKELERKLLQVDKMDAVGQLTGGIAHDFNNLLAVILSFAGFVHAELAEGDARRDLDEVLRAANKGVELIRQLLVFSRQQPQVKRALDVNTSLAALTKMLKRTVGENIELVVTLSPRAAVVFLDPVQVDQVVMNLAVNARDAMPRGGELRITIAHPAEPSGNFDAGRFVRILVGDTGTGMDAEVAARIFEPFYTTKGVGQSTGLGLTTCAAIVHDAGGTIRIDTEPGRGTTFVIELPVCDLPIEDVAASIVDRVRAQHEHVLVVEDDAALRRAAVRILKSAGYRVSQAADGGDAIRWLDEPGREVDLVFTDVVMPRSGGYAVVSHAQRRILARRCS
ncbi:MAG: PAS domain-containing protein [Myxococcales bacterium]|nr:PAS domain-containing protein [Myxococcales bacterium]